MSMVACSDCGDQIDTDLNDFFDNVGQPICENDWNKLNGVEELN